MKPAKKRKRGGQPKPPSERKRNNLTIRVLDDLREKLEKAAQKSKRSVSEEAARRMTIAFNLGDELEAYSKIKESIDDEIVQDLLRKRGWLQVSDPRYGGFVLVRPGLQPLPPSALIPTPAPQPSTDETATQIEKAVAAALPPAIETAIQRAVEKAVLAALARATLRIGENGG